MKDLVIPGRRIVREVLIFLGCFVVAFFVNVYAIHKYKTEWRELVTTLHITAAVAGVLYVLLGVLRIVICGVARVFRRKAARPQSP